MPYTIVRNDLLKVKADAIVLPSNSQLIVDGGVGALVAFQSDFQRLQAAVKELAPCPAGSAVTTPSFAQNAQYYIHAVGPVWQGGSCGEDILLAKTYQSVFAEVIKKQCSSVAMPLISAGTFGYPVQEAFDIAVQEIRSFINNTDGIDVTLVVYDSEAFAAAAKRFEGIRSYIEHSYVPVEKQASFDPYVPFADCSSAPRESSSPSYIERTAFDAAALKLSTPRASRVSASQPASSAEPMVAPKSATKKRRSVLPAFPDLGSTFGKKERGKKKSEKVVEFEQFEDSELLADFECSNGDLPFDLDDSPKYSAVPSHAMPSMQVSDQAFESWTCACGSVNSGNFCPVCGRSREKAVSNNLESWISSLDEGFSVTLCKLIDKKNLTDPQVYKRANISRQLFSKIRSNPDYQPKKATAVALCVALELSMTETQDLLRRAGFALSSSNLFDVIVSYHIENGIYDYFQINDALFSFDCPILGAK